MNSPYILLAIPNAIHSLGPCAGITCIPEIWLKKRVNLRIADDPGTIKRTLAPCRFGRLLPVAAELVERVERNHFDEPELPVSLDGHPSPGEQ